MPSKMKQKSMTFINNWHISLYASDFGRFNTNI